MFFAKIKKSLKNHLIRIVRAAVVGSDVTPSKQNECLSSIAIQDSHAVFQVIGPVANHVNGKFDPGIFSLFPEIDIEYMIGRDPYNLPATCDRELYNDDRHYDWWLSGLLDYLKIIQSMAKYGRPLQAGDVFYEMGCASGRVLRHFALQHDNLQVWGSDINNRHIEWMRLNLPPTITIFQNTILPQLPLESNSIDIACAFSVFTHIDDLEFAWLCEIRRVLKKGGFFYATIHSDDTWKYMGPKDQIYKALVETAQYNDDYKINADFIAGPLPRDKTVFSWPGKNYNTNVFHTKDYIRREWGRFFKIHEIIRAGSGYQDVVLMQKPLD